MDRTDTINILIVDDEPDFLELSKTYLEKADKNLNVSTSGSAEEGMKELEEDEHEVVVSDYKMSGMDGIEFLKSLREQDRDIPFIILTGRGGEDVAMDALNAGANGYFQKGGDLEAQFGTLAHEIRAVAEKRWAEEAFERSKERFEDLFEGANELILTTDPEGSIQRVNRKVEEVLEHPREELVEENILNIVHPDDEETLTNAQERIQSGEESTCLIRGITKREDIVHLRASGRPIFEDEEIVEIQYNIQDITDLREAELLNRSLLRNAQVGIYIIQNGKFKYVNPRFEELTGYSKEELLDTEALMIVHPEDRERVRENAVQMLKGKRSSPYQYRVIRKDGDMRQIMEKVASIPYERKRATVGSYMDVTKLRRAEERLDELRRFRLKKRR